MTTLDDVLYKTPEMTEEKLLEIIGKYTGFMNRNASNRLREVYIKRTGSHEATLPQMILDEWDTIQKKESLLTKSQRDQVSGLVSMCLIEMTKGNG